MSKKIKLILLLCLGALILGSSYYGYAQYQSFQIKQAEKQKEEKRIADGAENLRRQNEQKVQELATSQQKSLDEARQEIDKLKEDSFNAQQNQAALEQKIQNVESATQSNKPDATKSGLSTSDIVSADKKYIVSVMCETRDGYSYGSGIIVGKSYYNKILVLTNYHVTEGFYQTNENQPPCVVGLAFAPPHFAQPTMFPNLVSQATMKEDDWSFLEIRNQVGGNSEGSPASTAKYQPIFAKPIDNSESSYIPLLNQYKTLPKICDQNELNAGDELVALGYPEIGGGTFGGAPVLTLIATEGVISSEPETWKSYFVSSAKIEHGNSGGGAFLKKNGCLAGMPTSASVGKIESLAQFINIANLKVQYSGIFDYIQR